MKRKVCKQCKLFYEGAECPQCKGTQTAVSWQGRIKRVDIAKALGQQVKGEIVIRKIDAKFGQSKAKVIAYAYADQASKERIETKRGKKEKKEKKQKNKTPKVE